MKVLDVWPEWWCRIVVVVWASEISSFRTTNLSRFQVFFRLKRVIRDRIDILRINRDESTENQESDEFEDHITGILHRGNVIQVDWLTMKIFSTQSVALSNDRNKLTNKYW